MIENIFPSPLYIAIAEGSDLADIQYELRRVVDEIPIEYKEQWGKTHQVSKLSNNIIEQYSLTSFKTFLNHNIKEFLGTEMPYEIESWVSVYKPDDYGHIHCHGNADLSGVYYFQTNNKDGDIVFYNPTVQADSSTLFSGQTWKHPPHIGKLLLFPGYMKHGVNRNTTQDTRISLSFNIFFNKR